MVREFRIISIHPWFQNAYKCSQKVGLLPQRMRGPPVKGPLAVCPPGETSGHLSLVHPNCMDKAIVRKMYQKVDERCVIYETSTPGG